MIVLIAHYRVRDVDRFHTIFAGFEATRRERGATGHRLLGSLEDPKRIVALIDFASRDAAEHFAAGPERAAALEEAGVLERSDEILEEIER